MDRGVTTDRRASKPHGQELADIAVGVGDLPKRDAGETLHDDVNSSLFVDLAHRRICWLFARVDSSRWQRPLSRIGTAAQQDASPIVNDDSTYGRQHKHVRAHVPAEVSHILRDRHSHDGRPPAGASLPAIAS